MRLILTIVFTLVAAIAPAFAQTDIRSVDFRNFTYVVEGLDGDSKENVKVVDGHFSRDTEDDKFYFGVTNVEFGDMTGDGKDEAVVTTIVNTGGTGNFSSGYVFTMKGGKPIVLTTFEGGDRAYGGIDAVSVVKGELVVDRYEPGESGGACCPEFLIRSRYKWNGTKLVETAKSDKRALYPLNRVSFKKGTSMSIETVKLEAYDRKRFVVGARKGQTLLVSTGYEPSETVSFDLYSGQGNVERTKNGMIVKLTETGDFVIEIANLSDKPIQFSTTIEIN